MLMQVKGKKFAVQVFGVSHLPENSDARYWGHTGLQSQDDQVRAARRRRRKRASIVVDDQLQSKSGAKMKPLIGRQAELNQVNTLLERTAA